MHLCCRAGICAPCCMAGMFRPKQNYTQEHTHAHKLKCMQTQYVHNVRMHGQKFANGTYSHRHLHSTLTIVAIRAPVLQSVYMHSCTSNNIYCFVAITYFLPAKEWSYNKHCHFNWLIDWLIDCFIILLLTQAADMCMITSARLIACQMDLYSKV